MTARVMAAFVTVSGTVDKYDRFFPPKRIVLQPRLCARASHKTSRSSAALRTVASGRDVCFMDVRMGHLDVNSHVAVAVGHLHSHPTQPKHGAHSMTPRLRRNKATAGRGQPTGRGALPLPAP